MEDSPGVVLDEYKDDFYEEAEVEAEFKFAAIKEAEE